MKFLCFHRGKDDSPPLENKTYQMFSALRVVGAIANVVYVVFSDMAESMKLSAPPQTPWWLEGYAIYCEFRRVDPIPYWEDALFAKESKVIDEKCC